LSRRSSWVPSKKKYKKTRKRGHPYWPSGYGDLRESETPEKRDLQELRRPSIITRNGGKKREGRAVCGNIKKLGPKAQGVGGRSKWGKVHLL